MTSPQDSVGEITFSRRLDSNRRSIKRPPRRSVWLYSSSTSSSNSNSNSVPRTNNMKFTTLATALFTLGLGADMAAAAACCDLKVCNDFNLKGRCKTACYPYGKVVAINGEGLNKPIASAKTDTDCTCAMGGNPQYVSCCLITNLGRKANTSIRGGSTYVDSRRKGSNLSGDFLRGVKDVQCTRNS